MVGDDRAFYPSRTTPGFALGKDLPPAKTSRMQRWVNVALGVVIGAAFVRLIAALTIPMTGDEAYYWEWSRHPAFGYFDHPPMVAWLIALFSMGVKSTLLVRLPFVLSGLGCSLFVMAFGTRTTGNPAAGATAALLLNLTPFANIAFTVASPDGPYLLFWAASLYFGLRALDPATPQWRVFLAASLGCAVLSRILGVMLVAGCVYALALASARNRTAWATRNALKFVPASLLVIAALLGPYLVWNGLHGWQSLHFQLISRQQPVPGGNIGELLGLYVAVLTPGIFVAVIAALVRLARQREPAEALLFGTALPLLALCVVLAFRERVEFYWADGSFISLIAAAGMYAPSLLRGARYAWVVTPAAIVTLVLYSAMLGPLRLYHFLDQRFGLHLRHEGPFEIWAYQQAAQDVAQEANRHRAWVMTDGYGLSSLLDFYAGIPPVVIGYDAQGRELRDQRHRDVPSTAIFFDKEPLASRPDFQQRLTRACSAIRDDGQRSYYVEGILARTFYLTRCEGLTPKGFSLLRWGV